MVPDGFLTRDRDPSSITIPSPRGAASKLDDVAIATQINTSVDGQRRPMSRGVSVTGDEIPAERKRIRLSRILSAVARLSAATVIPPRPVCSAAWRCGQDWHFGRFALGQARGSERPLDVAARVHGGFCGARYGDLLWRNHNHRRYRGHELIDSSGQAVEILEKGKDLYVTLKSGRQIRAHRLSADKCSRGGG